MAVILRSLGVLCRIAAFIAALACAAAALAGQGARWKPELDIVNQFEPVWLIGALVAGLIGWRDRATLAVAAVAVVVCAAQMGPELLAWRPGAREVVGAPKLKLIQFNAWASNQDPKRSADWLLKQDADVVVMEESVGKAAGIVSALRPRYPYLTACGEGCPPYILSKTRPLGGGAFDPPAFVAAWARFRDRNGPYVIIAMHSPHPYPPSAQSLEHDRLAKAIRQLDLNRLVIAGDFNNTPWTFATKRLDRMLKPLVRRDRALATWPSAAAELHGHSVTLPFPILPIDHVYAGPGWRTLGVERGPSIGSDHRPIVVTLQGTP